MTSPPRSKPCAISARSKRDWNVPNWRESKSDAA
jgi:hypothetical protein